MAGDKADGGDWLTREFQEAERQYRALPESARPLVVPPAAQGTATHHMSPARLRDELTARLPAEARVIVKHATINGRRDFLRASIWKYPNVHTDEATLAAYAAAVADLPGIVRAEIVRGDPSLRDQVVVIHRRQWEE